MIKIEINRKHYLYLPASWFSQVAEVFSRLSSLRGGYSLSLALVGDEEIKKLNKIYRGKSKDTDVLSFVEEDDGFASFDHSFLGEIVISIPTAKKQAKELGHSLKKEVTRLFVHGLAHLVGYEHENVSEKKAQKMFSFEEKVMKRLGL